MSNADKGCPFNYNCICCKYYDSGDYRCCYNRFHNIIIKINCNDIK